MQLPTSKTPVSKCTALGRFAAAMLGKFTNKPALLSLAASIAAATDSLEAAQGAYAGSVLALVIPRVGVRYNDYVSDNVVRALQRQAEMFDGKRGGATGSFLFPDGVTPIVRPVGKTQVDAMQLIEGRLDALASWPDAAAEKAKLSAARASYAAALSDRDAAMLATAALRAKRDAAKEDFLDVYASVAAKVKSEFPRDRPMQDLFFDKVTDAVVADDEEPADDPTPPAPPAPPPA